jgi:group I intron endonuclease
MSEIHYVYVITNLVNGKKYIGDHSTNILNDSYLGSGIALKEAIKKYGRENFEREILKICGTKQEAFDLQKLYIEKFNTLTPNGYNICPTGGTECSGGTISESTRLKLRYQKLGIPLKKEHREKTGKAMLGKKHSEKTKELMSQQRKGITKSEDHKRKIGEAQKGERNHMYGKIPWNKGLTNIFSEDAKEKIGRSSKGNSYHSGHSHSEEARRKIGKASEGNQYWINKTHTEESKKKMSESHQGKIPANKGIPMTDDQKEKLRISHLGKNPFANMPIGKCIYCGAEMKMSHLNRYHNKNCKTK